MGMGKHRRDHQKLKLKADLLGASTPNNTIAILGNSIAAQDTPFNSNNMLPVGCFQWANYIMNQKLVVSYTSTDLEAGYLGIGGDTSTQILARLGSVIALKPAYCLLLGIIENDVENVVATAITQANITSLISSLLSAGIIPIICTGVPNLLTDSAAEANAYYSNNDFIRNLRYTSPGAVVVDISNEFVDYAQTYPKPLATHVAAGPHPNVLGAYYIGKKIADTLNPLLPGSYLFTNHWLSVANGGTTPQVLCDNPLMEGNGGTNGTGVAAAGGISDGWTAQALGGGSGVVTKVARTDIPNAEWMQEVFTGDAAWTIGDYGRCYSAGVPLPNGSVAVGDIIQAFTEVEVDAGDTNLLGLSMSVRAAGAATEHWNGMSYTSSNNTPLDIDYPAGVIASPKFEVPAGTTSIGIHVRAYATAANASFTWRAGRTSILKLN